MPKALSISFFLFLIITKSLAWQNKEIKFHEGRQVIDSARSLASEGKYSEAIQAIQLVMPYDSSYRSAQVELVNLLVLNNSYDSAVQLGMPLLSIKDRHFLILSQNMGNALTQLGKPEEGIKIITAAIEFSPYSHNLYYFRGKAKGELKEYKDMVNDFLTEINHTPFYAWSHFRLGQFAMQQGHRTKALMAMGAAITVSPKTNSFLVSMQNLVTDAEKEEGSIQEVFGNNGFEKMDNLLRSKLAMDNKYDYQIDFDVAIVRQMHLLITQFSYDPNSSDPWMKTYGPFYQGIKEQGLVVPYLYHMLTSAGKESVQAWKDKKKNKKEIQRFYDYANQYMWKLRDKKETIVLGKKDIYDLWFHDNNRIQAIGNKDEQGNRIGPWIWITETSLVQAKGFYNEEGNKTGTWTYYDEDGRISSEEALKNGDLEGNSVYYHSNGQPRARAFYVNEKISETLQLFDECGILNEKVPFNQNGEKTGDGTTFYPSGKTKIKYSMINGELDGLYTMYLPNGKVDEIYSYKEGKLNGDFTVYHYLGSVIQKGTYKEGELHGEVIWYHPNGKVKTQGIYVDGKPVGKWVEYFHDGKVSEEISYSEEGEVDGEKVIFDITGSKIATELYKDGLFIGYGYRDKNGEWKEKVTSDGNFDFIRTDMNGTVVTKGKYEKGEASGYFEYYYYSGSPFLTGNYEDGLKQGEWIQYHESGAFDTKAFYKDDKLHGLYRAFDEAGNMTSEGYYNNDNKEGTWNDFYADGSVEFQTQYNAGSTNGFERHFLRGDRITYSFENSYDQLVGFKQYLPDGKLLYEVENTGFPLKEFTAEYWNGKPLFSNKYQCDVRVEHYSNFQDGSPRKEIYNIDDITSKAIYYSSPGIKSVEGNSILGNKEGVWTWYYPNGEKESVAEYYLDQNHGTWTEYWPGGKIRWKGNYVYDKREGPFIYYSTTGDIQIEKTYHQGEIIGYRYETAKGKWSEMIPVGVGSEKIVAYFPNGKVSYVQNLENTRVEGKLITYTPNGKVDSEGEYKLGVLNGRYVTSHANGIIFEELNYKDGQLNGAYSLYYDNGKPAVKLNYVDGVIEGEMIVYSKEGKVISSVYYDSGEIKYWK